MQRQHHTGYALRITLLVLFLLAVGLIYWYGANKRGDSFANTDEETAVRSLVADFGSRLDMVILAAPETILVPTIRRQYGAFVTDALLNRWITDPTSAPGRLVSSPWPDRIDIDNLERLTPKRYQVTGRIIEITSVKGLDGGSAAERPITLAGELSGNAWLIDNITLGAYENPPGWVSSSDPLSGVVFQHPKTLGTVFIHAEIWPPKARVVEGSFICQKGVIPASATTPPGEREQRSIGDHVYCVTVRTEGAAGSVYVDYEYTKEKDGRLAMLRFTLRIPNCNNYDEPQKSACETEQETLELDALVDRIAETMVLK